MFRWKLCFGIFSALAGVIFLFLAGTVLAATGDIQITEIMYDPSGADTDHEWVELKNTGSEPVELAGGSSAQGWRFFDGSNHTLVTSTVLAAGQFLVLVQDETKFLADHPGFGGKIIRSAFSLVNTTSTLALRVGSDGAKWSEVLYDKNWGAAGNGKSLEKKNLTGDNSAGNWQESAVAGGTPGADNSGATQPSPPAESVPASDSSAIPRGRCGAASGFVDSGGSCRLARAHQIFRPRA